MKLQSVTQMQKDVRVILEESVNSTPLEGVTDVGSISINDVIKGVLEKAVTAVANVAPMELFLEPSYKRFEVINPSDGIFVNISEVNAPSTGAELNIPFISNIPLMSINPVLNGITGYAEVSKGNITVFLDPLAEPISPEDIVAEYGTLDVYMGLPEDEHILFQVNINRSSLNEDVEYITNGFDEPAWKFTSYNGGYFKKPLDYLRTFFVQAGTWQRSVTVLTPLSSPFVSIARSEINMSVGNVEKPLVVDSFVGGKGSLEIYPAEVGNPVDFVYVEQPKIRDVEGQYYINCDDGIYHAATLYAAYLVAMIKGYQNAEGYKNTALEAITQAAIPTNATAGAEVSK